MYIYVCVPMSVHLCASVCMYVTVYVCVHVLLPHYFMASDVGRVYIRQT